MLIKIDYVNSNNTTYKCDRCGKILHKQETKGIGVTNEKRGMSKKWDLCLHCYTLLEKAIKKGPKHG